MAGAWNLEDPDAEEAAFADLARRRRILNEYSTQAIVAQRATELAQYAPWMAPGAVLGLAQGGHGPQSPLAQAAAEAAVEVPERKKQQGFFGMLGEKVYGAAKGVSRAGVAALSIPYEAGQAQFRNITSGDPGRIAGTAVSSLAPGLDLPSFLGGEQGEAWNQTNAGVMAEDFLGGEGGRFDVDAGSGFFTGGDVARVQAERARAAGSITYTTGPQEGTEHAITPGRFAAKFVTEPGSRPYQVMSGTVDAAIALADPSGKGLGRSKAFVRPPVKAPAAVRMAQKVLPSKAPEVTGMVDGTRRTVLPEIADNWFASKEGRRVVEAMADETDFHTLWTATKKKLPVDLTVRIADARTPDEVRDILRSEIGVTVRDRPQVGGLGVSVKKKFAGVRAFQQMPGASLPINDLDEAVEQLDRFQRNAKLPEVIIARNNEQLARATSPNEMYDVVVNGVLGDVDAALAGHGVDARTAKRLTRGWQNSHAELTRYFVDEIGENAVVPGAVLDGTGKALPTPHLLAEYLHSAIPLPDARDLRTATSRYRRILENPAVKLGVSAGDFIMQDVWKPMRLLRAAWTVRVVGEEQIRMGASGLDSVLSHPMSAIAWATGRKGATGLLDDPLEDAAEFSRAMSQRSGGWRDNVIRTRHKVLVGPDEEDFARSWAGELAQLSNDPVARRVAAGGLGAGDRTPGIREGMEGIKNWFFEGAGRTFRLDMAKAGDRGELLTREGADAYIDTVIRRVKVKTVENEEVLAAVATGRLAGEKLFDAGRMSKKAVARLDELTLAGTAPKVVKGDLTVAARRSGAGFAEKYDRAIDTMFSTLMSRPSNYLSRSPAFRQFYWRRAEELLPFMDDAAQQSAVAKARAAGLDDVARRMEKFRARNATAGNLTLADADTVAKGFALDETKRLLYSMQERSQWADSLRLVFPFGEAWKEVLTRWVQIGAENPGAVRKLATGVQAARGQDAGYAVTGNEQGQGFFHTNDQGEEMFSYPGTGWLTQRAIGMNVPLEARVQGLNLFSSSVIPGFGPVVTMPAGALIPDRPEYDGIRDILMPFGPSDTSGGVLEAELPPWAKRLLTAAGKGSPTQERQFANTVFDLARAMTASGEFPANTPEQVDRLMSEARERAKVLYVIRSGAQFVAPSAPVPTVMAEDKEGRMVVADLLVKDYRQLQETLGYDAAIGAFLDKYGSDALLYMQPKTRALADVPATKDALDFVRRNPDLAKKFPLTYGLFVPQGGDFDYAAYQRQIERGTREAVSPEQAVALANARVANWIYSAAKDKAGASPPKPVRDWLFDLREALKRDYPGFGDYTGLAERATTEQRIEEVATAIKDEKLASTPAGQAISTYLQARDRALQAAQAQGLRSFATAKKAAPLREWLRSLGEALAAETPDFAPAWDRLFRDEIDVPGEEETP